MWRCKMKKSKMRLLMMPPNLNKKERARNYRIATASLRMMISMKAL